MGSRGLVFCFLLAGCAAQPASPPKQAATLDEAIANAYVARGENQKTADCLGRAMSFAIPAADRPGILNYMNGRAGDAVAYRKWVVIGHERDRPELVDTMMGYCPLELEEFAKTGAFRQG